MSSQNPIYLQQPVNREHPANSGRVAWWLVAPGLYGGNKWYDLVNSYHGALTNFSAETDGGFRSSTRPGGYGSILINSYNRYIDIGNKPVFNPTTPFSVSCWCMFPSGSATNRLFFHRSGSTNGWEFGVYGGQPQFRVCDGSNINIATSTSIPANSWRWITGVWDGQNVKCYTNGVGGTPVSCTAAAQVSMNLWLGTDGSSDPAGFMDSYSFWNRSLSNSEIYDLYNEERLGYPTILNRTSTVFYAAQTFNELFSGGAITGGTGPTSYSFPIGGGAALGGRADDGTISEFPLGGSTGGGSASVNLITPISLIASGLVLGGGTVEKVYSEVASGGIIAAGLATKNHQFINDPLSGSPGSTLQNWDSPDHTYWLKHSSSDFIDAVFTSTGGVTNTVTVLKTAYYTEHNWSKTAEYDIAARLYRYGSQGTASIVGRFLPSTAGGSGYYVTYDASNGQWSLIRVGGSGSPVTLGSYTFAIPLNGFADVTLVIRDSRKSIFINGVERIVDSSDNVITGPGTVAVILNQTRESDGLVIDLVKAYDPIDNTRRTHMVHYFDTIPMPLVSPVVAHKTGDWNSTTTWSEGIVPVSTNDVYIPDGIIVTISGSVSANQVQVLGTLTFDPTVNTGLNCRTVYVETEGTLLMGTEQSPVLSGVTCTLTIADESINTTTDPGQFGHGLIVAGTFYSHGAYKTSFVRCATGLTSGQTSILLQQTPTNWLAGDRVVVPDSRHLDTNTETFGNYTPQFDEQVIQSASGTTITLQSSLDFAHPGARNYLDIVEGCTPHVLNLTRNVVIKSANAGGTRGHFLSFGHCDIIINNTLFKDLGRTTNSILNNAVFDSTGAATSIGTNQLGRYPIHVHHVHGIHDHHNPRDYQFKVIGSVVDNGSDDHDFKWGIAIHDSHWGLVKDNNVYNTAGFGIGTEDGNESYNVIDGNFVLRNRGVGNRVSDDIDPAVGVGRSGMGFWLRGPNNYVRNNVASGIWAPQIYSYGYVFAMFQLYNIKVPKGKGHGTTRTKDYITVDSNNIPILEFNNNEIYGATQSALTIWWLGTVSNSIKPNQAFSVIDNFVAWHYWDMLFFQYEVNRLILRNLIVRGDRSKLAAGRGCVGISGADYMAKDMIIENADIQMAVRAWGVSTSNQGSYPCIMRNSVIRCQNAVSTGTLWTSGADAVAITPRNILIDNVVHDVTNVPGAGSAFDRTYDGTPVRNLIALDRFMVQNFNQIPGNDFEIYYQEQSPSFVVPQTVTSSPNTSILGSPDAGLTNAQNWSTHGIAIAGAVAPCSTVDSDLSNGYVCTLSTLWEFGEGGSVLAGTAQVSVVEANVAGVRVGGNSLGNSIASPLSVGGSAVGGVVVVGLRIVNAPTGGIICGGNAVATVSTSSMSSGGCAVSGIALSQSNSNITTTGGMICSGNAQTTLFPSTLSASGCLVSGSAVVQLRSNIMSVGGMVCSGNTLATISALSMSSGGCGVSGIAVVQSTSNRTSTGGLICSGNAAQNGIYVETTLHGVLASGSASVQSSAGGSGGVLGGNAVVSLRVSEAPVAGVMTNGSGSVGIVFSTIAQGGCSLIGTSFVRYFLNPSASGGAKLAGLVEVNAKFGTPPILGGAFISGSFKEAARIFTEIGQGGITLGGFARKSLAKDVRPGMYCIGKNKQKFRITRKCQKSVSYAYVPYRVIQQLQRDGRINKNGFLFCPNCY